jgi:hypothetical protein
MPNWDYRKIDLNNVPRKTDDVDLLNDAGYDGWELIAITGNNFAYMKRQLEAIAPSQEKTLERSTRRRIATNAK